MIRLNLLKKMLSTTISIVIISYVMLLICTRLNNCNAMKLHDTTKLVEKDAKHYNINCDHKLCNVIDMYPTK